MQEEIPKQQQEDKNIYSSLSDNILIQFDRKKNQDEN